MKDSDETNEPEVIDEEQTVVRQQFDWGETSPPVAVAEALGEATGKEPTEIQSLFDFVDTDALEVLIRTSARTETADATTVAFSVRDRRVTVSGDGFVCVEPLDRGR